MILTTLVKTMLQKLWEFLRGISIKSVKEPESIPMVTNSDIHRYFSRRECLMGREVQYPLTEQLENNLRGLLTALNQFREIWGKPMIINSLYRPGHYNVLANGAPNSAHITCEAIDVRDTGQVLAKYVVAHQDVLAECGLYCEDPASTPGWVHLQVRKPASGNRIFKP
jgi:hypothetical protein